MHTKSLDIKTRILGGDSHLDVTKPYNNVAIIYEAQGKYGEALEMHMKSLDIKTRILGCYNHPDVAASHVNHDWCFSTLVLGAFLAGVFQHQCITPH